MGIIILRKQYVLSKYLSVLMITIGIVICTIISGSSVKSTANPDLVKESDVPSAYSVLFWWTMGISLLTVALFISARMGIYQEVLYKRYGKHPREALYVTVSNIELVVPRIPKFCWERFPVIIQNVYRYCVSILALKKWLPFVTSSLLGRNSKL